MNDYVYLMLPPDNAEPFEALVDIIGRDDLRRDARFSTPPERANHIADRALVVNPPAMKCDASQPYGLRFKASEAVPLCQRFERLG